MKSNAGTLAAPFPYFGGKSGACSAVWSAFGRVENYVEPFAGSAAMLLGAPDGNRVETINDADGFVSNFWRAVSNDHEAVAQAADWPCNEADLFARHSWLVRQVAGLTERLHADPDYFDAKIAGWWCWGACNWIGSGWCAGVGPWVHDGEKMVCLTRGTDNAKVGVWAQSMHLSAGRGVNRQLPHLGNAGRGVNRQLPHLSAGRGRTDYIFEWFEALMQRTRNVRVAVGDWQRVLTESVTTRHGMTGVFLDPPYTKGAMDYAAGGVGGDLADQVRDWCQSNGENPLFRIVLCGHAGEHDALLDHGWHLRTWTARKGYAVTDGAVTNSASETLWCSPHCMPERVVQIGLFET